MSFWLSTLNVQYRDVGYLVPFIAQFWMCATPVVYPASMIPDKWRLLYCLNPMTCVVEGFRWALFGTGEAPGLVLVVSVITVLILLVSGAFFFKRMEDTFADVVCWERSGSKWRKQMTNSVLEVGGKLLPVFQRHHIRTAIVFGSFARGDVSRHSDVDLVLVQQTDKRFLDRYDGLLCELGRAVPDRDLGVLIYTPQELSLLSQRPFVASVLREGKVIYESEQASA